MNSALSLFLLLLVGVGLPVTPAWSQSRPVVESPVSAAPELRVCTQNQNRLYEAKSRENLRQKEQALVERIVNARCDVIALQEVIGESEREAQESANRFIKALGVKSLASYDVFVGASRNDTIHTAIAVRKGAGKVLKVDSLDSWDLPRLQRYGPGRNFTRLPQAVLLDVPGVGGAGRKQIAVLNLHLKSHVFGWKDPTGTDFEVVRMEMSEAIRDWATRLAGEVGKEGVVLVLGDSNSERGSAAADVLAGKRILDDFRSGVCSVDTELKSSCPSASGVGRYTLPRQVTSRPERFSGLLERALRQSKDLERYSTYRHGGGYQILDEILITEDDLAIAQHNGLPNVGTEGNVRQGSDHRLAWVELNW